MNKRILALLTIFGVALFLLIGSGARVHVPSAYGSFTIPDPCNTQQRQSVPIAAPTAAGTYSVISAVPGEGIYVCGQFINVQTLSDTIKWEYGTTVSTPCDTGAQSITGVIATPAASPALPYIAQISAFTMFSVPAGNQLCIVTTGTTPVITGYLTFVQG